MAIVQLVNIVPVNGAEASEFWYVEGSSGEMKFASLNIDMLKQKMSAENKKIDTSVDLARDDWGQHLGGIEQTKGHAIGVSYAVAWDEKKILGPRRQPAKKFWIIQPEVGRVLSVVSRLDLARKEFEQLLSSQWNI